MGHVVFLKVFFGVAVVVPAFGDVEGAVLFHAVDVGFPADVVDEFSAVARRFQNFINSIPVVWIE